MDAGVPTLLATVPSGIPPGIELVSSPVNVAHLARCLIAHPDRSLVNFLLNGFSFGFDLGYRGPILPGTRKNLLSARSHPAEVTKALMKEVSRGHTVGPFRVSPYPVLHVSPLGAVAKKDGSFRIILDLSSPAGESVNEGICKDEYSVRYQGFDEAVSLILSLGPGSYMAKVDVKHAFRLCPVRPQDFPLLGMFWQDQFFIDTRLPFGGRSSPFIFNSFADALAWILIFICGVPHVRHYLDDFFIASADLLCFQYVDIVKQAFQFLGVPIADDKLEGPSTCLTYLGIEIDSILMQLRLPDEKLLELRALLLSWQNKRRCTKKELLSLIGKLSFAAKVIKPGRLFVRRLIDLSKTVRKLHHHLYISHAAQEDIEWWRRFLDEWNGVSFIQSAPVSSIELQFFTDASFLGFGGLYQSHWFSAAWPSFFDTELDINYRELFAVVVACQIWGHNWVNKQVVVMSDNKPICDAWLAKSAKDPNLMKLFRHLFMHAARLNFNIIFEHLPGRCNYLADLLSRLQVEKFKQMAPFADVAPTHLPPCIWRI